MSFLPQPLIKARWALEEQWLGPKWLFRGQWEHRDVVSQWNGSTEGTVRQRWNTVMLGKRRV